MKWRTKIAIFEDENLTLLEDMVNEFIENKEIIHIDTRYIDVTQHYIPCNRVRIHKIVTIIYKEYQDDV